MPELRQSPNFMRAATVIRNSVMNQARIIDDLMDMSRVRTGKLSLTMSPVVLDAVLQGIVDVARSDPAAEGIAVSFGGSSEGVPVLADVARIEQVVMNLLSNAVKFTPKGGTIALRLGREDGFARVDVADSGQGIAPSFLPHVFDMWGQSASVTTRARGGLGIGLALVREIVALHGGRVEAASEGIGKGARFSFWLPVLERAAALPGEAGEADASLAGVRILLVDDMEDMLQVFKALLETTGATVFDATSAMQGLDILAREDIDILITDISMPEVDGYEFLRRAQRMPKYAGLPAIAITSMRRDSDIAQARASGFSAHLGKPVSVERLSAIINELLPRRGGSV
jgi:two-component system CheB/CheR fusion protein